MCLGIVNVGLFQAPAILQHSLNLYLLPFVFLLALQPIVGLYFAAL